MARASQTVRRQQADWFCNSQLARTSVQPSLATCSSASRHVYAWLLVSAAHLIQGKVKPGEDEGWLETEHEWIRVHNQPRMHAYIPEHDTALLMDFRRTECFSTEPAGGMPSHGEVEEVAAGAIPSHAPFLTLLLRQYGKTIGE